jgi:hypothetical protein
VNFDKFQKLEILNIASNMITHLNFRLPPNLRKLNAITNFIAEVQLPHLHLLEDVNLSGNQIKFLKTSSFIRANSTLKSLKLTFNGLIGVERNFFTFFEKLIIFNAYGNNCVNENYENDISLDDFEDCFVAYELAFTTTTTTTEKYKARGEMSGKDLAMSIVSIILIAVLLFALIYYIHDLMLIKEEREKLKRKNELEGKDSMKYDRF